MLDDKPDRGRNPQHAFGKKQHEARNGYFPQAPVCRSAWFMNTVTQSLQDKMHDCLPG